MDVLVCYPLVSGCDRRQERFYEDITFDRPKSFGVYFFADTQNQGKCVGNQFSFLVCCFAGQVTDKPFFEIIFQAFAVQTEVKTEPTKFRFNTPLPDSISEDTLFSVDIVALNIE